MIRFHFGTVHVGQGIDGPELMIALRSRRVNAIVEVEAGARPEPEAKGAAPFSAGGTAAGGAEEFSASA